MNKRQTENFKCNFFEILMAPEMQLIMMFCLNSIESDDNYNNNRLK